MKVYIKDIETRTYDPYEDKIHSFKILGQLENSRMVKIRDLRPFDLRNFIGKVVDCLISVSVMGYINAIQESDEKNISSPVIRGKYLGEYTIPEKWKQCKGFKNIQGKHAIDYYGVVFLITQRDFQRQNIEVKIGDEIIFQAGGLELKAWLPLEEGQK